MLPIFYFHHHFKKEKGFKNKKLEAVITEKGQSLLRKAAIFAVTKEKRMLDQHGAED